MSAQHRHPQSKAALRAHAAAVRAVEQEASVQLDRLYTLCRRAVLLRLDTLLVALQAEQHRLNQRRGLDAWDESDEDDSDRPRVSTTWLDGPQGRLPAFTASVEHTVGEFAAQAGALIATAHAAMTAAGGTAARDVLAGRSASAPGAGAPPPAGTLAALAGAQAVAALAGTAGNGQPVASLLDGLGTQTAREIAQQVRVEVAAGSDARAIRTAVGIRLDSARHRAQTVLTDSLWRGTAAAMLAVYRAHGRAG